MNSQKDQAAKELFSCAVRNIKKPPEVIFSEWAASASCSPKEDDVAELLRMIKMLQGPGTDPEMAKKCLKYL